MQALALESGITPKWVFNKLFWEILALSVLHERTLPCSQWLHAAAKAEFENKPDSVGSPLAGLIMRKKKINVNQSILGIGFILCWIRFRGKLYWEMWRVSGKVMIPALSPSGNSWREYVLNVCLQVSKGNYIHFRELVMYVTTFCWKLCCPKGLLQQAAELSERDLEHKSLTLSEQHTIQAIKFSYKHRERPRLW